MLNHIAIIRWIKKIIPFSLKIFFIRILVMMQDFIYIKLHLKEKNFGKEKKIFVLLSTDYSNLGDHAMTFSHIKFLKEHYPERKIIEVLVNDTMKYIYSIKKCCLSDDVITLKGGGNVGIEYFREELIRRKIITFFPENKIVMFPQTVYFPNTKLGDKEFKKTINIFNGNQNFYAFYRDRYSYELMKMYCERSFLTPDIVLSLRKIEVKSDKKIGALTCLRSDVEGIYGKQEKQIVNIILEKTYKYVYNSDTIRYYKIEREDREKELLEIWKEIARAEILVTDRLHAMIFAALIGTPCIALETYNHKLEGQYEWLSHLNYIKYINLTEEKLGECIESLKNTIVEPIKINLYDHMYEQIINVIENSLVM